MFRFVSPYRIIGVLSRVAVNIEKDYPKTCGGFDLLDLETAWTWDLKLEASQRTCRLA